MNQPPCRLFYSSLAVLSTRISDYPVLTDLSRPRPSQGTIFKLDTTTKQLIDQFLVLITQSAMGPENADVILDDLDLQEVRVLLSLLPFGDELREFFCANGTETLSKEELCTGFQRLGENFMSRSHEIQHRANSFIVKVIGCAVLKLEKHPCTPKFDELFEKARRLFVVAPSRENSVDSNSEVGPLNQPVSETVVPVNVPVLFRSNTTKAGDMRSSSSCFTMNADTKTVITEFFRTISGGNQQQFKREDCTDLERYQYRELWDFFDHDFDGNITLEELQDGLSMLAEHFIAVDMVSQQIANSYVQQKISIALQKVRETQERSRNPPAAGSQDNDPQGFQSNSGLERSDVNGRTLSHGTTNSNDNSHNIEPPPHHEGEIGLGMDINHGDFVGHTRQESALIESLQDSLGPGFRLRPDLLPFPYSQDYWLQFGESRMFWFQQVDHGQEFAPFFYLDGLDLELVTSCPSAMERLRCMFLHLGVGIMVHPFVLQSKFRMAAERLFSYPDALFQAKFSEKLQSVTTPSSLVDMEVLHAIWPSELNGYRIMLVSFRELPDCWTSDGKKMYGLKSIVVYTPYVGPKDTQGRWIGKDIIMTLKAAHFTLLNPKEDERNSRPWSDHPIDDLVDAIEAYNIGMSRLSDQPHLSSFLRTFSL